MKPLGHPTMMRTRTPSTPAETVGAIAAMRGGTDWGTIVGGARRGRTPLAARIDISRSGPACDRRRLGTERLLRYVPGATTRGDAAPTVRACVEANCNGGVHTPEGLRVGERFCPHRDDGRCVGKGVRSAQRVLSTGRQDVER